MKHLSGKLMDGMAWLQWSHSTGDGHKMAIDIGAGGNAFAVSLEMVMAGKLFADELGHYDYVTGEMWKNKGPFPLILNC